MARGGARPGAGRPKLTDEEKAARAAERKAKRKAPAKKPAKKAAAHSADGVKKPSAPQEWPFGVAPAQTAPQSPSPPAAEPPKVLPTDALEYLQSIYKDPAMDDKVRMQAAYYAMPFERAKPAEAGKKAAKDERAKKVAGRFSAAAPPKLVAAGGKAV